MNISDLSDDELLDLLNTPSTPLDAAIKSEGSAKHIADIARSIYQQESSSGKNTRTSNAGAVGGMQMLPATFNSVADKGWDITNPVHNARAGLRYISQLHKMADGDPELTAVGYYGGPKAIEKARSGVAVSDPRNPNAPNTLQYAAQVAARLPKNDISSLSDDDLLQLLGDEAPTPEEAPKTTAKKLPTNTAVAVNALNKGLVALPDALLNAPVNVWNLAKAGFGTAATAAGHPDLAPDLTPTPNYMRGLLEAGHMIRPEAEPGTAGQRILDSALQGAGAMMVNPAGSVPQMAANMLVGGASGLAGGATKEKTGDDTLALLATLATPAAAGKLMTPIRDSGVAANQLKDRINLAAKSRNSADDATIRDAQDAGYVAPPGMLQPNKANNIMEGLSGKQATEAAFSVKNQEVTNKLARQALKLPNDTPLTPEVTQALRRNAYQEGYEPVKQVGQILPGKLFRDDLKQLVDKYEGPEKSFPGTGKEEITKLVEGYNVRGFDAGDAVNAIRNLRQDASKSFKAGDEALALAQKGVASALEKQIERTLQSQGGDSALLLKNYKDARKTIAKSHSVEDAMIEGSGSIDANKIAAQLKSGVPLDDELATIGKWANVYRKANKTPQMVGSPSNQMYKPVQSGIGAAVGGLLGGPVGAVAGAAAPSVIPPIARTIMMSPAYQKMLRKSYSSTPSARSMLSPEELTALQGLGPALGLFKKDE